MLQYARLRTIEMNRQGPLLFGEDEAIIAV